MHDVDTLADMSRSNVRHDVGSLFAAELAVGTLEARLLAAFVFKVARHVALDGEAARALGTSEGLVLLLLLLLLVVVVLLRRRPHNGFG